MNISVVVAAKLILFLAAEATQWLGDVALSILAADHEANLARRVCGNRRISILDSGEDFLAILLELGDQREV